jgi:hypothetical protein
MKMIADYLENAIKFQRMADDEKNNPKLKTALEKQAAAYQKLALLAQRSLASYPRHHLRMLLGPPPLSRLSARTVATSLSDAKNTAPNDQRRDMDV